MTYEYGAPTNLTGVYSSASNALTLSWTAATEGVFEEFTSNGTFTIDPTADHAILSVIGAGGGGAGGGYGDFSGGIQFIGGGAGAGGGGGRCVGSFSVAQIGAGVPFTLGVGGIPGTGVTNGNGNAGQAGGASTFGSTFMIGNGGQGGVGGIEGGNGVTGVVAGGVGGTGQYITGGSLVAVTTGFSGGQGSAIPAVAGFGANDIQFDQGGGSAGAMGSGGAGGNAAEYGAGGGGGGGWTSLGTSASGTGGSGGTGGGGVLYATVFWAHATAPYYLIYLNGNLIAVAPQGATSYGVAAVSGSYTVVASYDGHTVMSVPSNAFVFTLPSPPNAGWGGDIWGPYGGSATIVNAPEPVLQALSYATVAANRITPQTQSQSTLASQMSDCVIPGTFPVVNLP